MRRKTHEEACFCGLKAVIKKSGTTENLDRLFYVCPRYRKDSHCNYFKWVDDDDDEAVVEGGAKEDSRTELQVESEYDEWRRYKINSKLSNTGIVEHCKLINITVAIRLSHKQDKCLKPEIGTKVIKLASFLAVAELVPLMVSVEIATGTAAVGVGEDLALAFTLITCNLGGLATTSSYISQYQKHFKYTTCCVAWVGGMLLDWLMSISVGGWMGAESEGNGGIAFGAVSCSTGTSFTSGSAPSAAGATTASCSCICLAFFSASKAFFFAQLLLLWPTSPQNMHL
ncbi:hypothetical protein Ahy_B10g104018 [Arachis hypogaea]|uniref:GRF-type domain-containing protein n=1 Tax=Arachis hypogaea TaxID=3818 RepID=A0A444X4J9_ARAHY|nr:hypothetical protein Ahy_B10g104018 [Arachis hypogaea]